MVVHIEDPEQMIVFLRSLRAVREFRQQPVPQEVIDAVLEVVRWSGSASNRQPWEVVVIHDRQTLQALAHCEGFVSHLAGAALGMALVMAGEAGQEEQEVFDEGRLSERIMLAASAYEVGSCIGWLKGNGIAEAKNLLGIPEQRRLRTLISLGYPDEEARHARPKRPDVRKPMSEIVRLERYS
jgi:nitroreductase